MQGVYFFVILQEAVTIMLLMLQEAMATIFFTFYCKGASNNNYSTITRCKGLLQSYDVIPSMQQ
jgi:hypothetical protein